jgi:hypothetical protein
LHSRRFGGWLALLMLIVIHSDFLHDLNNQRVEVAGLKASALGLEMFAVDAAEKGFSHLATRTVMNANEQDLLFHA